MAKFHGFVTGVTLVLAGACGGSGEMPSQPTTSIVGTWTLQSIRGELPFVNGSTTVESGTLAIDGAGWYREAEVWSTTGGGPSTRRTVIDSGSWSAEDSIVTFYSRTHFPVTFSGRASGASLTMRDGGPIFAAPYVYRRQ